MPIYAKRILSNHIKSPEDFINLQKKFRTAELIEALEDRLATIFPNLEQLLMLSKQQNQDGWFGWAIFREYQSLADLLRLYVNNGSDLTNVIMACTVTSPKHRTFISENYEYNTALSELLKLLVPGFKKQITDAGSLITFLTDVTESDQNQGQKICGEFMRELGRHIATLPTSYNELKQILGLLQNPSDQGWYLSYMKESLPSIVKDKFELAELNTKYYLNLSPEFLPGLSDKAASNFASFFRYVFLVPVTTPAETHAPEQAKPH
jgi:hypothetical protein